MDPRRSAAIALALGLIVGACQSLVVSPSARAEASPPGSQAASGSPQPDVSPTIDPDWITRPALTCGEPEQLFPPEALEGPGLAELGFDAAAGVLRSTIAEAPPETPFPEVGWHRVRDGPDGVTFVAAGDDATPWWAVTVGVLDGTLQATGFGQCHLAIAAPSGVSFARWWLDPDGPPISPETTSLSILLREQDCASGQPPIGRVLAPTIITTADTIEIVIVIRKQLTGQDCPGNPAFPLELVLPGAIGSRALFDASQFPPRPVTSDDPG
ncbi:MAG: hypothetical protein ACTS8Z_06045 [Candidatus Limnocylindrales bacterium]